jgi:hypothetical protein
MHNGNADFLLTNPNHTKKMRLGKVKISLEYVVDLDNEEMVDHATGALYEDLMEAYKHNYVGNFIITEEDKSLKEENIPEFLLDTAEY